MGQLVSFPLDMPQGSIIPEPQQQQQQQQQLSTTKISKLTPPVTSVNSTLANPNKKSEDQISNYTEELDLKSSISTKKEPINYPRRKSIRSDRKRKRRCCLFKRRRKADQDDTRLLRSFSTAVTNMGSSSEDDDGNCLQAKSDLRFPEPDPVSIHVKVRSPHQPRRTRVPNRPDVSASLWAIIKNAIGKDLTKLPLPVNFNEPLSMLQRLTEDYEYSALLDKAAAEGQPLEQMAYVASFTISSYASSANRTGKPFNPLLGETFECDRMDDLGWRCFSEQVSHHPPLVAQNCQGRGWTCWQQFSMSSKFRGNSIEIVPLGTSHLTFTKSGAHYTWKKVPSIVHNIMIGKLWIDQEGEMEIFNHTTGDACLLKFIPTSFFKGDAKKVEGTITEGSTKQAKIFISGSWDSKLDAADILKVDRTGRYTKGPLRSLWTRTMPPGDSEKYYNFTLLACQLNEMEEDLAPTDSRNRPDQRLMENGYFDDANNEKLRLEEKQRAARKLRVYQAPSRSKMTTKTDQSDINAEDMSEPNYSPAWFSLKRDQVTGKMAYVFNGEYWDCKEAGDWSRCQDIY